MQYDVYADILFLINFSMDYLCLYICARVLHRRIMLGRTVIAAAVGGLYSVIALFLPLQAAWGVVADGIVCAVICAIAFVEKGRGMGSFLATAFLYVGISMMTGGCMTAIFNLLNKLELPLESVASDNLSTYLFAILAVIAGLISLKSGQVISRKSTVRECKLYVKICGEDFEFSGFADSGNLVREPISGRPIIFLERAVIEKKMSLDFLDKYSKGELSDVSAHRKLFLISFRTASGSSMTAALRPDSIRLEFAEAKRNPRSISPDVLVSPIPLGKSAQGYNAIIPAEIVKE